MQQPPAARMKGDRTTLRIEERPGDVLLATLDRPEVANAFNTGAALELCELFERFRTEQRYRCAVITGARDDNASVRLFGEEPLEKFTQFERRSGVEGVGDLGAVERRQQYIAGPFFDPQRLAIPLHAYRGRAPHLPGMRL